MILAALAAAAVCSPVPGTEALFTPERRWVIVGETHGTNESPEAFANLACLAGKTRRPVTVALEYPANAQPVLDAWLQSDGDEKARATLLALSMWHNPLQDGRTSAAFLRLFDRLRRLKQQGLIAGVRGFDMPSDGSAHGDRNAYMAARLTAIADETGGLVLVLVGNFHAIRTRMTFGGQSVAPAASLLPSGARVSVNVVGDGGSAWNCQSDGCRVHSEEPASPAKAGIMPTRDPADRFDAIYELGKPFTAAEPAVRGIADTSAPDKVIIKR